MTFWLVVGVLIKIGVVVGISQGAVAYLILAERKIAAYAQDRIGPNRAGREFGIPFALLQPLVDGAKMLLKEDMVPSYVNKPVFILAPMIAIFAATISFAVVPFGGVGPGNPIQFQLAPNVDIGILYIFAVGSLGVYGVILAGWSSNNKYSFLGGLRSSAQLISYEIPLGLSILGIVLIAGSLDLNTIINWQDKHVWGVFVQPLGCLLFLISAFAETNRLPFDLPESEQELVGGFHTEYSAMKFGMFFLGEYLNVITVSYLTVILFFGGWDLPFVTSQEQVGFFWSLVKCFIMMGKVGMMIFFMMWVRWTLPRFRYDTLMDLAWKSLIPLSLVNLVATAAIVQLVMSRY
ncbi:NADH-quinone oxidoreductase subunit NuoH [Singulisphaera acidiphila]|uniref:NADH-quinone oxidoreductase subunit H n=1 Tax=Singulisphaera acidiphila (strain ATCC BAA-1392 / DSM 18658 / VKM B-2454 / MOB10) TaxID=886293 RepID=L0DCN5_SINAD|nr:NADH-quinone oxidoreductase subunit NuoH [Singulisphaera acidiphila]AGA26603.1 NADH:ubiquinone oxidoreductase subunit 1 (chain H) [Singulisphaera acidiphila DSM 18658]